jgi:hypothetical protein
MGNIFSVQIHLCVHKSSRDIVGQVILNREKMKQSCLLESGMGVDEEHRNWLEFETKNKNTNLWIFRAGITLSF